MKSVDCKIIALGKEKRKQKKKIKTVQTNKTETVSRERRKQKKICFSLIRDDLMHPLCKCLPNDMTKCTFTQLGKPVGKFAMMPCLLLLLLVKPVAFFHQFGNWMID